jgi:hypothetical protein
METVETNSEFPTAILTSAGWKLVIQKATQESLQNGLELALFAYCKKFEEAAWVSCR